MEAKLVVLRGADAGEIDLFLPFLIGRSADAELKIPHESVSREHCRIYEFDGELAVRDLGSRNGTLVNGQRIDKPTFLSPGDELTVGGVTFQANYQIRRQVVITPHEGEQASNRVAGDVETVTRSDVPNPRKNVPDTRVDAVSVQSNDAAATKRSKAARAAKRLSTKKAEIIAADGKAKSRSTSSDIPVLEPPTPIVAEVPVLKVDKHPPPVVDEVHLETDAPVELVREDELKGFLDELE